MTERNKFIAVIISCIGGLLPQHIIKVIAPQIADKLISEGAGINTERITAENDG